jgi:hypothetical protein
VIRGKELIGTVVQLAQRVSASCTIAPTKSGHVAAVLAFNGRTRKIFLSSIPSDCNARHQVRRNARRVLRELGAVS